MSKRCKFFEFKNLGAYLLHFLLFVSRSGQPLHEVTMNDVYYAKDVVDSAFHPDTGEKMILFGRMSAQVPMNMIITGCMITFYK